MHPLKINDLEKLLFAFQCSHSTKSIIKAETSVIYIYCTMDKDLGSHLFHGVLSLLESFKTRSVHHCCHWPATHRNILLTQKAEFKWHLLQTVQPSTQSHKGNKEKPWYEQLLHGQSRGWISWKTLWVLTGSGCPGTNNRWNWYW